MSTIPAPDEKLTGWMRDIRRHIHQNPELAFDEKNTADFIGEKLDELSISYQKGVGRTGLVATLGSSEHDAPCVALRADMDALPIAEETGLPFSSQIPGVMHACGHDGHVAMLLGAAALLRKAEIPGRIVFIFQPAEEGDGGATGMIEEGVLDGVDAIFSGHIDRHYNVGEIAVQPGLICAFTDEFRIEISSKGGHAAKPHETADSIVVASLLVMSLQTLVSREVNPAFPSVVTVGQISGGTAPNVIASRASLEGTIRTTHPEIRKTITEGLKRMVKAMENLYQVKTEFVFIEGYPPVINDATAARIAGEAAAEVIGRENVKDQPQPSMGGEDFSFYLRKVPGCMVRLGARRPELGDVPAHSPRFDFDEAAMPVAARFFAQTACRALERIDELRMVRP